MKIKNTQRNGCLAAWLLAFLPDDNNMNIHNKIKEKMICYCCRRRAARLVPKKQQQKIKLLYIYISSISNIYLKHIKQIYMFM